MGDFMLTDLIDRGPFRQAISLPRRRARFHVMATSAGYEIAGATPYVWDGRRRGSTPFSVLQHTIAGAGRLVFEKRLWQVQPGETMLVTVPHDHRYWLEPGESWSFFWIAMCGQEALRLHRTMLEVAGPVFRLAPATVAELAGLCSALAMPGLSAGRASCHAYQATMAAYDDLTARHSLDGGAASHEALARVTTYVRDHLDQTLDVGTLAAVAGLSRAHFSRVFTRVEGIPPSEYVMQQRMQRAARMLVGGQISIKAVAGACGFNDQNYFAKAFRRVFAVSPSEFRTNGMYSAR